MSTATNPFKPQHSFTGAAIELMRCMSDLRQQHGKAVSSPQQIVGALTDLGYHPADPVNSRHELTVRFLHGLAAYQRDQDISHPTCEDVLSAIHQMGWTRPAEAEVNASGLPIDRRRRAIDLRSSKTERRSSTELSTQERLELTQEEHQLLDDLAHLRETTGRDFASSEELLCILWDRGFRPTSEDGIRSEWFDDDERVRLQSAFTHAIEESLSRATAGELLTCRNLLQIAKQLGFRQ